VKEERPRLRPPSIREEVIPSVCAMRIGMEASVDILLLVILTWSEIGDLMNRCGEVRLLVLVLVVQNGVSLIYCTTNLILSSPVLL
jgi:hypothetical protein